MNWLWMMPVLIVGSAPIVAALGARRLRLAVVGVDADTAQLAHLRREVAALRTDARDLENRLVSRRAASRLDVDDR